MPSLAGPRNRADRTADVVRAGEILIVNDESDIRNLSLRILREQGHSTLRAEDERQVLTQVAREPTWLILCKGLL